MSKKGHSRGVPGIQCTVPLQMERRTWGGRIPEREAKVYHSSWQGVFTMSAGIQGTSGHSWAIHNTTTTTLLSGYSQWWARCASAWYEQILPSHALNIRFMLCSHQAMESAVLLFIAAQKNTEAEVWADDVHLCGIATGCAERARFRVLLEVFRMEPHPKFTLVFERHHNQVHRFGAINHSGMKWYWRMRSNIHSQVTMYALYLVRNGGRFKQRVGGHI